MYGTHYYAFYVKDVFTKIYSLPKITIMYINIKNIKLSPVLIDIPRSVIKTWQHSLKHGTCLSSVLIFSRVSVGLSLTSTRTFEKNPSILFRNKKTIIFFVYKISILAINMMGGVQTIDLSWGDERCSSSRQLQRIVLEVIKTKLIIGSAEVCNLSVRRLLLKNCMKEANTINHLVVNLQQKMKGQRHL